MKKVLAFLVIVTILSLGSGCVGTKQLVKFPDQTKRLDNPAKARIYVARPAFAGSAISMRVKDGDTVIGSTGSKGFLCWERDPGTANITSKAENTSALDLTVEKGGVYYIHQQLKIGILIARNKIVLVDEEKGKKLLGKCKPPKVTTK